MTRPELDDLKARVDLVEVIRASGVTLKRNGKSYKGLCPFHAEDSPSFSVTPEAGLWHCFGCQAGGDVFRFFQLKKECSFPEALAHVQQLAGVEPASPARNGKPRPLAGQEPLPGGLARAELLGSVAQRYAEALRVSEPARAYLEKRGLGDPELAEAFGLGFADGSLLQAVPAQGEVRQALEQVGLISREGRELLAGCLVVPLTHPELGTLSLYGRKLSPRAQVHHLYLPGPKRGVLNWQALAAAPARVTLTESVLDALSVWAAGERSVTCLFGVGGLPPDLEETLRRFAVREVQLCLDADETGQEAARRLAERLTGQGLRCWNVPLPVGSKDPNQLLCEQGSTALREALSRREAFPDLAPPVPEVPPLAPQRTDEGLRLAWDGLAVTLTLHPPFKSRLRVTLRVERGEDVYRHTFELSSYRNRAQAARDLGRRFSREPEGCERFLLELLELAEGWVDEWRADQEAGAGARRSAPPMAEADRQEALAFLSAPYLLERILADMEALGTVGESRAKLMTYLIAISRKLEYPLSGILGSQSAAGKSGIAELVEALCPPEDVVWYSRLSPMALYNMASDYLKRKFVMVEESSGSKLAEYPIRVLQSRHKLTQVVTLTDPATGKMRAQENEVEGPIAYLETTTAAKQVHYENATRCFLIHLDESEEQTRRIHAWQRQRRLTRVSTQSVREPICRRHQNAQRLLEFAVIRIPYVEKLSFPSRWLRTRRDHERFLCLVEAVAFLHQFQRPQSLLDDGTRCIEAQVADYRIAYELAQEVLAQTLHELSRDARELLALVAVLVGAQDQATFTRRDLRQNTQWQDHRLREALDELVAMEYLHQVAGGQGRTSLYQLAPGAAAGTGLGPLRELTSPDELERIWSGEPLRELRRTSPRS